MDVGRVRGGRYTQQKCCRWEVGWTQRRASWVDTVYAISRADGPATVVPMNGERCRRCRLVAALYNDDERNGGKEKVGVTTYLTTSKSHHYSLLHFLNGLIPVYVDFVVSSTVVQGGGD